MKLLSIVVPSYNSQDYLEACLDSLVKGGERVEVLVVDDGSTDRTGEIADAYPSSGPSISPTGATGRASIRAWPTPPANTSRAWTATTPSAAT